MNETKGYFKVDERICELQSRAISEQGIKVYLLHCMRLDPTKHLNCSLSGFKDANRMTGVMDAKMYQKAMADLVEKHLVKMRPDVNVGYLKSTAVEVLTFPKYDAKSKRFTQDRTKEHEHRTYPDTRYLQIPNNVFSEDHMKHLTGDDILTLLRLYRLNDAVFHGVDFREVHCYNKNNPIGCTPFKKDPYRSEIDPHTSYWNIKNQWNCECLNHLYSRRLITFQPALIYADPQEPENTYVIDVLKEDDNGKYILDTPRRNQKVIHILQMKYQAEALFIKPDTS